MEIDSTSASLAERLRAKIEHLPGVPSRLVPRLGHLGLRTAQDLLFFFPRTYEDVTRICPIVALDGTGPVSVCGLIDEVALRPLSDGRSVLTAIIRDESSALRAVWFNQPFLQPRLARGQRVLLSGVPKRRGLFWELAHPRLVNLRMDERPERGAMLPVYPATEGLSQALLRRIVHRVVDDVAEAVVDVLPPPLRARRGLWPIGRALRGIHMPQQASDVQQSRARFAYQELLTLQLALALRRWQVQRTERAPALPASAKLDARIRRLFPFELTGDQRRVVGELARDMARGVPMNRLLQGEVGSGKTVVAEYAMLLAVAHGYQAVVMAPTEVLALQHYQTLSADLRQSRVRIAVLTGSVAAAPRAALLAAVRAGEIDLLIGTQALLHESVAFRRLGLVVIDEQHKFGVRQRAALKSAGVDPHYLVMTATPIPRTVALSLFGDLDVSTLRSPPPGRQPVSTYWVPDSQRDRWWAFVRNKLQEGRQAYVITPRVEDRDAAALASVEAQYEQLVHGPLEAFRLDLLHGRLSSTAKQLAMEAFRRGETQVLVATSVVEVGVNVPNATVMTIESAERFGLAQLHQLRGRVSRGQLPGVVGFFATPGTEAARARLDALVRSNDGFELAELDFTLRGPGDLFGMSQHGMPPLRIADLQRDQDLLTEARDDARALVDGAAPLLLGSEYADLRARVLQRYGDALDLGDVA